MPDVTSGIFLIKLLIIYCKLLTKMLLLNMNDDINKNIKWECSDDNSCLETFNNQIFGIKVEKKCFISYISKPTNNLNSAYIFCWPDKSAKNYINNFCKEVKPTVIFLIESVNRNTFDKGYIKINYTKLKLNIKQLCYKDVISFFDDYSLSSFIVYINNDFLKKHDLTINKDDIYGLFSSFVKKYHTDFSYKRKDIFFDKIFELDHVNIIKILVDNYQVPLEFKNMNSFEFENILTVYDDDMSKIEIPIYLKTKNDILCWVKLYEHSVCPKNINSYDKFINFMKLFNRTQNDINGLKKDLIIPQWVNNANIARQCIILDYSYDDKTWKKNEYQFKKFIKKQNSR